MRCIPMACDVHVGAGKVVVDLDKVVELAMDKVEEEAMGSKMLILPDPYSIQIFSLWLSSHCSLI